MPKSENTDAFKIHYSMMTASGIWPKEHYDIIYSIKTAISWCLGVGICLTMWMETVNSITDVVKLSQILYIMVTYTAFLIKLFFFTYNRKKVLMLFELLKDPIFVSYPDDLDYYMANTIKYSTFLAIFFRYTTLLCVVLYGLFPILDQKHLLFPFSFELGNYTFLMYLFQLTGEGFSAWNHIALDTLWSSLMGIAAAQLDILAKKIARIREDVNLETEEMEITEEMDQITIERLNQCVAHHLAIIRYIDILEQIYSFGFLFQFLASAIVICNTMFHFISTSMSVESILLADYFVMILVQLMMYCWYGNRIMLKSVEIGKGCYKSKWYKCGNKVRKHLFIIMERSRRPLVLTALKLFPLSLTTFTAVLRWSYSILTLIFKVYQDRSM